MTVSDIRTSRRSLLAAAGGGAAVLAFGGSFAQAGPLPVSSVRVMPTQRSWPTQAPQQHPAHQGLVDVGPVKLWFWDTGGTGEPIVLLHPSTGSGAIWEHQQPVFAAAGYRVIGYSRRGHFGSEPGPAGDVGNAVDDLQGLVDALKLDRFHIVGSALGGFVVPDYALAHPERLITLTIACSQGGVAEPAYQETIRAITPQPFRDMPASLRELGPSYRAANRAGVARWEQLEHSALSGDGPVIQRPKKHLLWPDIERIRTPALLMTGAADLYMPPSLMVEYASHIPHAETAILGESGHSGYWEQPDAFNELVLDFVGRHPAR